MHLAELDTRDVYLREGYSSLFVYCRDALGLSEWEAYARIEVARESARGKRKAAIEEIVARLSPKPDVPTSIGRLATGPDSCTVGPPPARNETTAVPPARPPVMAPTPPPAVVKPLSPDRYKLQLTIGGETLEKLRLPKTC